MTVAEPRHYRLSRDRPAVLDVGARLGDVRRVAASHPAYQRCLAAGWEADDLDAEVVLRVLARQAMPSRYDPARAGLGKYLWVTCGGILANLARPHTRALRRESLGVSADAAEQGDDGGAGTVEDRGW